MNQPKRYIKSSIYLNQHSPDGQTKGKLDASVCLEEKDCTRKQTSQSSLKENKSSNKTKNKKQNTKKSSMQGCPQITKNTTLNDKLTSLSQITQITTPLPTLVPVLTSKDKDLKPFWNKQCQEMSEKLWLPTRTEYVDLDLTYSNGLLKNTMFDSWFNFKQFLPKQHLSQPNRKWHKTFWPFVTTLLQKTTGCDHKEIDEIEPENKLIMGVTKYKLNLTSDVEQKLNRWIGSCRFTYNHTMELLRYDKNWNLDHIRDLLINNDSDLVFKNPWLTDVPYDVRDAAMKEAIVATRTNIKKKKEGTIDHFGMGFRKAKARSQVIHVRHRDYKCGFLYPTKKRQSKYEIKLDTSRYQKLPKSSGSELLIQKLKSNGFFIIFPRSKVTTPETGLLDENQIVKPYRVVAIDPGVRTFITLYDSDGKITEIGHNDIERVVRLSIHMDKLISSISLNKRTKRERYLIRNRVLPRVRERIRNLISDIHHKVVKYLCSSYDCVIIPKFDVQGMILKKCRCIRSQTVRKMLTWSHYRFRTLLISKAKELGSVVDICTEEYTSQTRGCCGELNRKLGGSKINICHKCGYRFDRDWNGARNILIKRCVELMTHHCGLAPPERL